MCTTSNMIFVQHKWHDLCVAQVTWSLCITSDMIFVQNKWHDLCAAHVILSLCRTLDTLFSLIVKDLWHYFLLVACGCNFPLTAVMLPSIFEEQFCFTKKNRDLKFGSILLKTIDKQSKRVLAYFHYNIYHNSVCSLIHHNLLIPWQGLYCMLLIRKVLWSTLEL